MRMPKRHLAVAAVIATAGVAIGATAGGAAQAAGSGTGDLMVYGSVGTADTGIQMWPGASPGIALLSNGVEVGFANSTLHLETDNLGTGTQVISDLGLDPASWPGMTGDGSSAAVAFTAFGSEALWAGSDTDDGPVSGATAVHQSTSPSVAVLSSGAAYAYNDANQQLLVGNSASGWVNDSLGLDATSSPSIAALAGGGWEVAFNANGDHLWELGSSGDGYDTGDPTAAGTSPSIAALSADGSFEIAYQCSDGDLCVIANGGSALDTGHAMAGGTSPSITAYGSGYEVAYQASDGNLALFGNAGTADTGTAMYPGTNPAITATSNGFEVAFDGAPPQSTTTTTTATSTSTSSASSTQSAPTPTTGRHRGKRLRAKLKLQWTWSRTSSLLERAWIARKLPRRASVRYTCAGVQCPDLVAVANHRTVKRELAVAVGHVFIPGDTLTIAISAPGYRTERISDTIRRGRIPKLALVS